jgi:hypothetical protein
MWNGLNAREFVVVLGNRFFPWWQQHKLASKQVNVGAIETP